MSALRRETSHVHVMDAARRHDRYHRCRGIRSPSRHPGDEYPLQNLLRMVHKLRGPSTLPGNRVRERTPLGCILTVEHKPASKYLWRT